MDSELFLGFGIIVLVFVVNDEIVRLGNRSNKVYIFKSIIIFYLELFVFFFKIINEILINFER